MRYALLVWVTLVGCGLDDSGAQPPAAAELQQHLVSSLPPVPPAYFQGGATAVGVQAEGYWGIQAQGTVGQGLVAAGGPGVEGAYLAAGTAATPEVRRAAAVLANGDLAFGAASTTPTPSAPVANLVTPVSMAKAWARFSVVKGGTVALRSGLNIAQLLSSLDEVQVEFAAPFANAEQACTVQADGGSLAYLLDASTPSSIHLRLQWAPLAWRTNVVVVCYGTQEQL
jgi:hypothetical protein